MKILQVINRLNRGGGAEKFAFDLSMSLHSFENVTVDIASLAKPANLDFITEAQKAGVRHHLLSHHSSPWRSIIGLRNLLKSGNYDVVHVHLFPSLYVVILATLFMSQRPKLIYTEHSTTNKRRSKKVFELIDNLVYKRYRRIVAISSEVALNLSNHARINHITTISNGVDVHKIDNSAINSSLREELNLSEDNVLVAMVGRFVPGKDYATLIQALYDLPDNVHVVCIGDGPMRASIQSQTLCRPFANRVHFLGLRSDVISILKATDIIVLSTEHEGFSISMLEAMACNKPFVASAVPGIKDIVGDNALLFEYQNSGDLAKQIKLLTDNKQAYQKMSEKSRQFAERHDIYAIAQQYLSVYEQ